LKNGEGQKVKLSSLNVLNVGSDTYVKARGRNIHQELEARGIFSMAASRATMVEEIPEAYKDVADVVEAVQGAGIARKVARLRPIGVVKG